MNSKSQSVISPKATFWMGSRMILDNPGVSSSNVVRGCGSIATTSDHQTRSW